MAFIFDVNNPTQTGGDSMFKLKQLLVSAGWVVKSSGDGTSFSASGDVIAGAMVTTTAWFRIQQPLVNGVHREFVVQRNNSNQQWIIFYSYSAGFTGGAPSATVAPTATDQQTLQNGGASFFPTDNSYRWNMAAQNAAPYGFWSGTFPSGGGTPNGGAFCLFPIDVISLTGDIDPFVIYSGSASSTTFSASDLQNNTKTFLRKGLTYEIFTNTHACTLSCLSTNVFPSNNSSTGVGPNPHDGNDDILPIIFGQTAQATTWPNSFKGITSMIQWNGSNRASGDTLSVASAGAKDRICYNETNLPWNGSTPTV